MNERGSGEVVRKGFDVNMRVKKSKDEEVRM